MYKYINKGPNRANVALSEGDEIKSYINCRYTSETEAARRLNKRKMHDYSHSVFRLDIHLPNDQGIAFDPGDLKKRQREKQN